MAWDDLTTTIRIPGAKFVGAVKDGGVVIETHDIEYREGRVRVSMVRVTGGTLRPAYLSPGRGASTLQDRIDSAVDGS